MRERDKEISKKRKKVLHLLMKEIEKYVEREREREREREKEK